MDAKSVLDQILAAGRDLAEQGKSLAERNLQISKSGEEREAMMSGLGKGAMAGGLLALLLGTKSGRRLTGKALKYGSLAALGTVAYRAFQQYQSQQASAGPPPPLPQGTNQQAALPNDAPHNRPLAELTSSEATTRSMLLLRAMIAAAKADGHLDATEQSRIRDELQKMSLDEQTARLIEQEIHAPAEMQRLVSDVHSTTAAAEVYLASRTVLDLDHPLEREYLQNLSSALQLDPALVDALEQHASA